MKATNFQLSSIAMEKSTSVSYTVQLALFIHGIDMEVNKTEELAALVSVRVITTGADLYEGVEKVP
jgi:hypothetical protein